MKPPIDHKLPKSPRAFHIFTEQFLAKNVQKVKNHEIFWIFPFCLNANSWINSHVLASYIIELVTLFLLRTHIYLYIRHFYHLMASPSISFFWKIDPIWRIWKIWPKPRWGTGVPSVSTQWILFALASFLDVSLHLYKRVGPSVGRSIRPSVCNATT